MQTNPFNEGHARKRTCVRNSKSLKYYACRELPQDSELFQRKVGACHERIGEHVFDIHASKLCLRGCDLWGFICVNVAH